MARGCGRRQQVQTDGHTGTSSRSKSLRTLIDRDVYKDIRWGVKLVNGNVGFENGILTLPQWCAFKLPEIIRDFNMGNVT